jgi:hypothetical protein
MVSAPSTRPFSTFSATLLAFANANFSAFSQGVPGNFRLSSSTSLGKTLKGIPHCSKSKLRRGDADANIISSICFSRPYALK